MSVVVQLRGGLGNQLFQYAAGFSLSERLGEELQLDTALLPRAEIDRGGVHRWTEQLSGFAHAGSFTDSVGSSALRRRIVQSLAGRERALGDSILGRVLGGRVYAHETRDDVGEFSRLRSGARLNAYCNSRRFFADYQNQICTQVRTLIAPSDWYRVESARLVNDGAVAIHVRWGDYLNLKHVYGTIAPAYYVRSVDLIARSAGDRPVWLFSDDTEGAREYLRDSVNIARVVEPPSESTALENLLLLSSASGLVCANSSFSWWAALLAEEKTPVVFPRPLFADGGPAEPKDWLQSDWMQHGRD